MTTRRGHGRLTVVLGPALLVTSTLAALPGSRAVAGETSQCPWVSSTATATATATAELRAAQLLAQMTTAEKLSMTHGSSSGGYADVVAAIPRLCTPQLNLQDGVAGVVMGGTTAMPAPIANAATFDPTPYFTTLCLLIRWMICSAIAASSAAEDYRLQERDRPDGQLAVATHNLIGRGKTQSRITD